jgi:hypothetical protein
MSKSNGRDLSFTVAAAVPAGSSVRVCGEKGSVNYCAGRDGGCLGGLVVGSMIYRHDSNPCAVAVHAGVIDQRRGGVFKVFSAMPIDRFQAMESNGIKSEAATMAAPQPSIAVIGVTPVMLV